MCIWQSKNVVYGSMFFVWIIRLYIQVMYKILYIKPYCRVHTYCVKAPFSGIKITINFLDHTYNF